MRRAGGAQKTTVGVGNPAPARARIVPVWVSDDVARAVEGLAGKRRLPSRNAAFVLALRAGVDALNAAEGPATPSTPAKRPAGKAEAFERLQFRSARSEKRRIEAFRARRGYDDLSPAISDLITSALDQEELGENVPATKADELEQAMRELRDLLEHIGPGVLGILGLLAHWATQSGGLEVEEEELIEEALAEGQKAWELRLAVATDASSEPPSTLAAQEA